MIKRGLFIIFSLLLISFVSADLGTFQQGENVSLRANIEATSVNVSVYYPNSSIAINNQVMSNVYGDIWNYTFSFTEALGVYAYNYCDQAGNNCVENTFKINKIGYEISESDATIHIILFLGVLLTFILVLYFNIKVEWRNYTNSEGRIIGVNDLKYLKLLLLPITFSLLVWVLNLLVGMASYITLDIPSAFFELGFSLLVALSWPLFIGWLIVCVVVFLRDRNILSKLYKGLDPMKR